MKSRHSAAQVSGVEPERAAIAVGIRRVIHARHAAARSRAAGPPCSPSAPARPSCGRGTPPRNAMMFWPAGRVARQLDARLDRFGAGVAEERPHAAVESARSRRSPRRAAPAARSRSRCPTCAGTCCACSVIALTTSGCEWPVELTAMPAAQSRNTLPSTSSTIAPDAALDDQRIAARVRRRDDRRVALDDAPWPCGPGSGVLMSGTRHR